MLLFYPCIVRRTSSEAGVCQETKLPAAHLFRKGCAALRQSVPRPGGPGAGADRGKSGSFPKASNRSARRLERVRVRLVGGGFYDDIPQRATPPWSTTSRRLTIRFTAGPIGWKPETSAGAFRRVRGIPSGMRPSAFRVRKSKGPPRVAA